MKFTELAQFQDKQKEAWFTLMNPECKYLLYGGAMGGGKSYLLRWAAIGLSMYYSTKYKIKNPPIGLFSKDYPTLRDRQIARIIQEFPDWLGELKESKDFGLAFHVSPRYGDGRIMLRNLDDPSKYKSTEFVAEIVEELTENDAETFRNLRRRLRYPMIEEVKFLAATNPGEIGHLWCKKHWITRNSEDKEQNRFFYIPSRVYDNKFQTDSYIMQLESMPDKERKAFLEGSWEIFEGQYFNEWNEKNHVIQPFVPTKNAVIVGGMDWGRTNPFAFHLTTIEKVFYKEISFYRARTFFEIHGTDKKPEEWSNEIKTKLRTFNLVLDDISWVRADPKIFSKGDDGSISIRDQFVEADSRWRLIKPANNDRISGWNIVRNWLSLAPDGIPYWQITSNNEALITNLPSLIHDENVVEDVETTRKFGIDDDDADAMRYQFKHLKWIGTKSGGVKEDQEGRKEKTQFFARMDDEHQQISINPDRFRR
ncbi:MAG TPA: phage terminase large subunit [Candidatus Nitrosotalea sp.]|nr:phage terminase large subunit [Candidatus Nitrosotalea sp.]